MEAGVEHKTPHFHAYYQNDVAVFSINPIERIAGDIPKRQQRFIEAWAELHQKELVDDWNKLQSGEKPFPIDPLR